MGRVIHQTHVPFSFPRKLLIASRVYVTWWLFIDQKRIPGRVFRRHSVGASAVAFAILQCQRSHRELQHSASVAQNWWEASLRLVMPFDNAQQ